MKNSALYKNLLLSNLEFETYDPKTRKIVLLNILLYVSSSLLAFFIVYNFFYSLAYYIGVIDILAFGGAAYAIYDIRVNADIKRASLIATADIFLLMCALVFFVQGEDFTLIWTVFLPLFAIFINGSRLGVLITIFFYSIIFTMAYHGIGIWENGTWNSASFARLIAASLGLTLITYFFEQSLENAYATLLDKQLLEKKYVKNLEVCSITDHLTGLYNRRHLDVQFKQKLSKAKEYNSYFVLFILDLDKFKEYNDTYGHLAGDEALQYVAKVLQRTMQREADSTFRIGGEEFCTLFIANEHSKIIQSIQNVKESIAKLAITHSKCEHKVLTASIGVCIINSYEGIDLDKMYKVADDNLYIAKDQGRNCIIGDDKISEF